MDKRRRIQSAIESLPELQYISVFFITMLLRRMTDADRGVEEQVAYVWAPVLIRDSTFSATGFDKAVQSKRKEIMKKVWATT